MAGENGLDSGLLKPTSSYPKSSCNMNTRCGFGAVGFGGAGGGGGGGLGPGGAGGAGGAGPGDGPGPGAGPPPLKMPHTVPLAASVCVM